MMTMMHARLAGAMALMFFGVVTPAGAGPGHDHGDEPQQARRPMSPRVSAVSETFELVGILKGGTLVVYLDRAADTLR